MRPDAGRDDAVLAPAEPATTKKINAALSLVQCVIVLLFSTGVGMNGAAEIRIIGKHNITYDITV